jgi:hypothetical protein
MAPELGSGRVADSDQSRLMDIGYTKEVLGALVLTDDGLNGIVTGN